MIISQRKKHIINLLSVKSFYKLEELAENGYLPHDDEGLIVDGVPQHLRDIVCEYYNMEDQTIDDMYYYKDELYVTLKH